MTLTCCGIELRRTETRPDARGVTWAEYRGSRGDLSICVWQATDSWYGTATATVRWTGPSGQASERREIAQAGGTSPESCAATLGEMVESVRAALEIRP